MSTALYVKLSHSSAVWHAIMQSCRLGVGAPTGCSEGRLICKTAMQLCGIMLL